MIPAAQMPRISQITPARFHHVDLCKQLSARGLLASYFTAYPKSKLRDSDLPMDKVRSFPFVWPLYVQRLRMGHKDDKLTRWLKNLAESTLSQFASTFISQSDAVVAMSCSGLEAGRAIKRSGGIWICDRGSAHIRFQDDILREEHKTWGLPYTPIDPVTMAREMAEYEECHQIVVPSQFALDSFVQQGVPASKVTRVPYGVNLQDFYPGERVDDNVFRVLFVGGLTVQKGIQYLIPAVARLRGNVELIMLGDEASLDKGVIEGMDMSRVTFVGRQPKAVVREWMQRSSVLVLPSVQDGFGLVLAEAMACGCPVIGTTNTGFRDVAVDGEHGFLVPPRHVEALAAAIQTLVDDRALRDRMAAASVERVKSLGGWDEYGNAIVELVKSQLVSQVLG
ncbi:MAG: glycosyltransferase [Armatimonadetes bacterium]|nr:glycosyltransferase [Armatimonadota bacterium]